MAEEPFRHEESSSHTGRKRSRRACARSPPTMTSSDVSCSGLACPRNSATGGAREGETFSHLAHRTISVGTDDQESSGHSSEGGPVVDLTYDSGVEDEELVDLTSPVRIPNVDPSKLTTSSCSLSGSNRGRKRRRDSDVVILNESDDDVQIMDPPLKCIPGKANPRTPTKNFVHCPICMDTANVFERRGCQVVSTKCGHVFCSACIRRTIVELHRCPTCRKRLTLKQIHTLYL